MRLILILAFASLVHLGASATAQTLDNAEALETINEQTSNESIVGALRAALENANAENQLLRAQIERGTVRSSQETSESFTKVVESYNQSWIDYYDHEEMLRKHARSALKWQLVAASVVLVLVVAVAGLGVFLSYREVMASLKAPRDVEAQLATTRGVEIKNAEEAQAVTKQQTELVLSFQKLQLTSAVTGVVILGLSLAFLFLFLQSVFGLDPQDFAAVAEPSSENVEGTVQGE